MHERALSPLSCRNGPVPVPLQWLGAGWKACRQHVRDGGPRGQQLGLSPSCAPCTDLSRGFPWLQHPPQRPVVKIRDDAYKVLLQGLPWRSCSINGSSLIAIVIHLLLGFAVYSPTSYEESTFSRFENVEFSGNLSEFISISCHTVSPIPGIIPLPEMSTRYPALHLKSSDLPLSCHTSKKPWTFPHSHS